MFPQGTLVNQERRPLELEPGLGILTRLIEPVWLSPVAFRYDMVKEQRPDALISIGEPYRLERGLSTVKDVMSEAQARLTRVADEARQAALHEMHDSFVQLYVGRTSMEKRYDKVRGR